MTRAIEKRTNKRNREGINTIQVAFERVIKWKAGSDPKDNALQVAPTLNAFANANVMLVYEVMGAIDTEKKRIA
jgi:hypothetical protein